MKTKFLILSALLFGFFFVGIVQASNVEFNGDWNPGTTLESSWVHVDGFFYGKDVYKDRSSITTERVCTNKTITYKEPVCDVTTTYITRLVRIRHGTVVTYENRTRARTKKECHLETKTKIVESCRNVRTKIGCMNPNGIYTNQLSLGNFEYSLDGLTWNQVPYPNDKILINDDVLFRLNIPEECSPVYFYNKAIFIS